ncbi:MAG: aldehyde dehydrogenase, partial [Xanthomonadales bacterium]|nr:aldehyde dehydrogenase [Xanthomonadales bacterium]
LARSVDIPRAVSNFRFFAAQAELFSSECHSGNGRGLNYTLRQPLGAVGCISPWNLPLYLLTWKIAPALAAGNTVVAKPSEVTPYTAWMMGKVCEQIGLPAGVLNLVHGRGAEAGAALVSHRLIKAVSFTGSTATGAAIARSTADQFKKLSLEMGGKNAAIVFADADLDQAVEELVRGAFSNQGQICLCTSRILVERSVWAQFREAYVARVKALKVGPPEDPSSNLGAVVSELHMEKVLGYIALAHEEGGRLLCGGERLRLPAPHDQGWYIAPTVFDQLPYNCRVNQEEVFGPFTALIPFDDERQALEYANGTVYGLAASVWTNDLRRAHRVAADLESGIVWINCWMLRDLRTPFGGVKHSGVGREGGLDAMRFFTETKNVCLG